MSDHRNDDLMHGGTAEAEPTRAETDALIRKRQKSRALVTAVLLGAFVVLVFAISIVKIATGYAT
ncbi:hypothetical protein [Stakelama tenebrarum]|uniref:Uncharacterized protein n=1 Tax=Stakelama tenebrarum TaxID=2711215 RepID=A0A6G6Y0F4_9SPHN|nr:hypothetical protein [Sphingosinithalassobacter tenebrarum]QIG78321.1 hypothetical protein G5C33_00105 [Sphingosinithalassobacter tenebrarum]